MDGTGAPYASGAPGGPSGVPESWGTARGGVPAQLLERVSALVREAWAEAWDAGRQAGLTEAEDGEVVGVIVFPCDGCPQQAVL